MGPAVTAPVCTAVPSITGTGQVGQQLTANAGAWTGSPTPTYTYQWQRCDAAGQSPVSIAGATANAYTLVAADVGFTLRVVVTATKCRGVGSGSILTDGRGRRRVAGEHRCALHSSAGRGGQDNPGRSRNLVGHGPITFACQWRRITPGGASTEDIVGATDSTYTPVPGDAGSTIQVVVTARNPFGSAAAVSDPTEVVVAPPANSVAPSISGTAQVGQQLVASAGGWTGSPTPTFTYQWQRCDAAGGSPVAIAGATSNVYAPVAADVGATLRVVVTGTNSAGASSALSPGTPVVQSTSPTNVSPPAIRGEPYVGSLLTVDEGTWSGATPTSFAYQWVRCDSAGQGGVDIPGATEREYVPRGWQDQPDGPPPDVAYVVSQTSDVGSTLRVRVVAIAPGGSTTVLSGPTPVISDQPRDPTS